jgi:hypothetical protein
MPLSELPTLKALLALLQLRAEPKRRKDRAFHRPRD